MCNFYNESLVEMILKKGFFVNLYEGKIVTQKFDKSENGKYVIRAHIFQ